MADMTDEARELHLFISNDAETWRRCEAYFRALERHKAKGAYDSSRAASSSTMKAMMRDAAKSYGRQHSVGDGLSLFSPACRDEAAAAIIADFDCEYESGNRWTVAAC
jgi:hypothetical protein